MIRRNAKWLAASAGAALTWGTSVVDSPAGAPTAGEWLALGFAALGVFSVYFVKNETTTEGD